MAPRFSRQFRENLNAACEALAERDEVLAHALSVIGAPVVRRRPGGYAGLFRIIVEQQVSVPSAQAILKRCDAAIPNICAETILELSEEDLRGVGLSRPKVRYARALAEAETAGDIRFKALSALSDEEAGEALRALKGIGPWSAAIYLLFCEGRMDVWPPGDVALLGAYMKAAQLEDRPKMSDFDDLAEAWGPWRGVAAHILWTFYAHVRGRTPI